MQNYASSLAFVILLHTHNSARCTRTESWMGMKKSMHFTKSDHIFNALMEVLHIPTINVRYVLCICLMS